MKWPSVGIEIAAVVKVREVDPVMVLVLGQDGQPVVLEVGVAEEVGGRLGWRGRGDCK